MSFKTLAYHIQTCVSCRFLHICFLRQILRSFRRSIANFYQPGHHIGPAGGGFGSDGLSSPGTYVQMELLGQSSALNHQFVGTPGIQQNMLGPRGSRLVYEAPFGCAFVVTYHSGFIQSYIQ